MLRLLIVLALLALAPTPATAQLRFWEHTSSGPWTRATNWSSDNPPDTPSESAVFDRIDSYTVVLPDSQLSIDDLEVVRGEVSLYSEANDSSTLAAAGEVEVAGNLSLDNPFGEVRLQVGEALRVEGGELTLDSARIEAPATTLRAVSNFATTIPAIRLNDGATADFGDLTIDGLGFTTSRVEVYLADGANASVAAFDLGADSADINAEVSVRGALTQASGHTTTIGTPGASGSTGQSSLAVINGGSAQLGSLVVRATGTVTNAQGSLAVDGALAIAGGTYAASVTPLTAEPTLTVGGPAQLGGELRLTVPFGSPRPFEAGDAVPVLEAGSVAGRFEAIHAPTLAEGLEWRLDQSETSVWLRVAETSLPGDYNHDGAVDAADYVVWRMAKDQQGALLPADGDRDGLVGIGDLAVWKAAYTAGASAATTVPEPAVLAWLAVAPALAPRRRRLLG